MSLGVSLAAFLQLVRAKSPDDVKNIGGPATRKSWYVWLNVMILCQAPAFTYYYQIMQQRHEYPPWGDSIVIGIGEAYIVTAIKLVALNAALFMVMGRLNLNTRIFTRGPRTWRNIVCSLAIGLLAFSTLHDLWLDIGFGAYALTPCDLIAIYLLLSLRAQLCCQATPNDER